MSMMSCENRSAGKEVVEGQCQGKCQGKMLERRKRVS